jgi:hypothetical protein
MMFAKDGASVSAERLVRINCSKCGTVSTGWIPNDREIEEAMRKHIWEKHGNVDTGGRMRAADWP